MSRPRSFARPRSATGAGALARVASLVLVACSWARASQSQEFSAPEPPWTESGPALLERGLPMRAAGASFAALATRWLGLPELVTASVAAGGSWRAVRFAAGASHTGEGEIAWSAWALAAGWAGPRAGAGLRACVRDQPVSRDTPPARGVEVGAGAWAVAAPGTRVWASAPQLWQEGEAPPLSRPLEIGVSARVLDLDVWLVRAASPGGARGLRGEHAAGLAARSGPLALWAEIRDRPPRGGVGLEVRVRALRISFSVEDHPLLGETARWGVATAGRAP